MISYMKNYIYPQESKKVKDVKGFKYGDKVQGEFNK